MPNKREQFSFGKRSLTSKSLAANSLLMKNVLADLSTVLSTVKSNSALFVIFLFINCCQQIVKLIKTYFPKFAKLLNPLVNFFHFVDFELNFSKTLFIDYFSVFFYFSGNTKRIYLCREQLKSIEQSPNNCRINSVNSN